MGAVWRGRDERLDVPVALKFIHPDSAESTLARARFEREARAAAQLASPHIVQILDYGVDEETPYIAMELLSGEDLGARLRRVSRLAPREVVRIVRQLAKALRLAHDAGIVHRDLKPSNVFLARFGDDEVVKILDFGVARSISPAAYPGDTTASVDIPAGTRGAGSSDRTAQGAVVGSPEYMSPEQARGLAVDARSDLWSLGVLAYVALTGHRPFAGGNALEALVRICSDDVPKASSLCPDLPAGLDAFFARALCRSPDGRFASARALAEALAAAVGEEPEGPASEASPASVERGPAPGEGAVAPRDDATRSFGTGAGAKTVGAPPSRGGPARALLGALAGALGLAAIAVVVWRLDVAARSAVAHEATQQVTASFASEPAVSPSASLDPPLRASSASPPPSAPVAPSETRRAKPAPAVRPAAAPAVAGSRPAGAPRIDPKFGLPVSP